MINDTNCIKDAKSYEEKVSRVITLEAMQIALENRTDCTSSRS